MEGLKQERNPYSPAWFKQRALEGLRRIDDDQWDYSDSLLLYLPDADDKYETVQEVDTAYHKLVTAPERNYLRNIAPQIADELPQEFEYLDLGPGTEHKEQFLFDSLKEEQKKFLYRPVDISDRYLKLADGYASAQGIEVKPVRSAFEELTGKLNQDRLRRFVSLGLTYSNYAPSEILPLLKQLTGSDDSAFINAQIRERIDMNALADVYREVASVMTEAKLKLLGLDLENDIASTEVTDEVKVWQVIKNPSAILAGRGIKAGDRMLVFQSLRPSLETLKEDVSKHFENPQFLDTGESFVGVVLK